AGSILPSSHDPAVFLARYNVNGTLDTTFSQDGVAVTNLIPGGNDDARALVINANSQLVVAGSAQAPLSRSQFLMAQYNSNGSLDLNFGIGGIVRTNMPIDPGPFANPLGGEANALVIQPDGLLVAGGTAIGGATVPTQIWALTRYR